MAERGSVFRSDLAAPGFIKVGADERPKLTGEQRSALIRKGNELFNSGRIDQAKRVFITTRYSDGLIRVGDHCLKQNDHLEAFRMYWLAPDRRKADRLIERMADVVRTWLEEPTDE